MNTTRHERPSIRRAVLSLLVVLSLATHAPARAQIDVWVDPGHGGGDKGNLGIDGAGFPSEKDMTLLQSQQLVSLLGQSGWQALLTRGSDHDLPNSRRVLIAAGLAANDDSVRAVGTIFVSIHMNSAVSRDGIGKITGLDSSAVGPLVIYPGVKANFKRKTDNAADIQLATDIQPQVHSAARQAFIGCGESLTPRDLMKRDSLLVLRRSHITSVIVECCFMSNRCEFTKIQQAGPRGLIANGITVGVSQYLGSLGPQRAGSVPPAGASTARASTPSSSPESRDLRRAVMNRENRITLSALSEGFDGTAFPPTGWTALTAGVPASFAWQRTTDPLYVDVGAGSALVVGGYAGSSDEWLISPMVKLASSDRALRFVWEGNDLWASALNASCSIKRKADVSWTQLWNLAQEPAGGEFVYRERIVDVSPYIGDSVQVAYQVFGSNGADFSVDEVSTGTLTTTTSPPNALCANAQALGSGEFDITALNCYATNKRNPFVDGGANNCIADDAGGPDMFYRVNAQSGDTLDVGVSADDMQPELYLMDSCDSLTFNCVAGSGPSETSPQAYFRYVFPSTAAYYLVVDCETGACGPFHLVGTMRGTVTGVGDSPHPVGMSLFAYPNPARNGLIFRGALPKAGVSRASIGVLDISGRLLARIPVPTLGPFEVSWDMRDDSGAKLPAGVYFAQLTFGESSLRRTVVVSR